MTFDVIVIFRRLIWLVLWVRTISVLLDVFFFSSYCDLLQQYQAHQLVTNTMGMRIEKSTSTSNSIGVQTRFQYRKILP